MITIVLRRCSQWNDKQKNNEKAIECYTKALKIKDNPDTKNKLDKLTAGK